MKVSEVLQRWPELLEVLVEASPAFRRLHNPLLRRTMPRLVTVAQAARIAGMPPETLVSQLNAALGVETKPMEMPIASDSKLHTPPPPWLQTPVGAHLDVRPILEAGEEPFPKIMAAARTVKPGGRLVLEAPFEPLPLYRVLAKQGFSAWCEQLGAQHYRVHFYREPLPTQPEPTSSSSEPLTEADWQAHHAELTVDASWEPPLPMQRILEALAALEPGQRLLVHHVRRPIHLLARLEAEGYRYALRDLGPGRVDLLIEKPR
ncbi:DUF2249 domain-containing protein [Marinithermus hydrothermalis]|nr:DUF2249 domain-containing protein [Marinithermus hydrothermalis]